MARNYKPLVQVGFRTSTETKEFFTEKAKKENKTVSDLLSEVVEGYVSGNGKYEATHTLVDVVLKEQSRKIGEVETLVTELYIALDLSAPTTKSDIEYNLSNLIEFARKKRLTFKKQKD